MLYYVVHWGANTPHRSIHSYYTISMLYVFLCYAVPLFQQDSEDKTEYRKITGDFVSTVDVNGKSYLKVEYEGLRLLSKTAIRDIQHLLRPAHLKQLRKILDDPESTSNDKFVALELLKNANIAAGFVLPGCQDTGTAIVMGKRG